jgi:hypothetical protein
MTFYCFLMWTIWMWQHGPMTMLMTKDWWDFGKESLINSSLTQEFTVFGIMMELILGNLKLYLPLIHTALIHFTLEKHHAAPITGMESLWIMQQPLITGLWSIQRPNNNPIHKLNQDHQEVLVTFTLSLVISTKLKMSFKNITISLWETQS